MRDLSKFETATVTTTSVTPTNIVAVLKMQKGPSPDTLQQAFEILQNRHPLLSVYIEPQAKGYRFASAAMAR